LRLARAAGEDAANRRMRKAGRTAWSEADHGHAIRVTNGLLTDLGFDVAGWAATAGVPRNEPEELAPRKRTKRSPRQKPVQLSFTF
jgi:hypothetical protein